MSNIFILDDKSKSHKTNSIAIAHGVSPSSQLEGKLSVISSQDLDSFPRRSINTKLKHAVVPKKKKEHLPTIMSLSENVTISQ